MTLYTLLCLLFCTAFVTGILGALTGLGGGVILIPFLVIGLKINIYYAMGASLMCVIATSSGAAIAQMQANYNNLRIGLFLTTSAVVGAIIGASLLLILKANYIEIIFGVVLLISAYLTFRRKEDNAYSKKSHPWALFLQLPTKHPFLKNTVYPVQRVPQAWGIMLIGGILSSLLGIGSGALNVVAMDLTMRVPYQVATATSNFIIGIIASVSAGIYFSRGYIDPVLTFPLVLGVLLGSFLGGRILNKFNIKFLRIVFSVLIITLGMQMVYKGLYGLL